MNSQNMLIIRGHYDIMENAATAIASSNISRVPPEFVQALTRRYGRINIYVDKH